MNNTEHYFLSGGGEMGELIRKTDWCNTSLGDPNNWPQSLKTVVALMLDNPFGMYIAWGNEYIQLYNDGYRPILGSTKHPQALGISTRETFSEIWNIIGPMFDDVMKGKAVGFPDFMLPLNRNGYVEECYFDFSYSPIRKEDGQVGGVLVTVIETTQKKSAIDSLKESEQRFRALADNIPNLAWMAKEDGWIYWYNKKWHDYTGTTPDQMKGWGWQSVHDPKELPQVMQKWQQSIESGQPFEMIFPLKGADGKFRQFLTRILPLRDSEGKIYQWFGSNTDITSQKEVEEALKESQKKFYNTVKQAPVGITILRGKDYIVEMANDAYMQLVDRKEEVFVGRRLFDSLPEVKESVHNLLDNVFDTGIPYHGIEYPIPVNRYGKFEVSYFDFLYHPLRENDGQISGIIVTVTDVSTQVFSRIKFEEEQKIFTSRLESEVMERTRELGEKNILLEKMNKELQSFAFISSHDLQEPLRKIQTFASQIQERELMNLTDRGKDQFSRMQKAAKRMQALIEDLLAYSRTETSERKFEKIELSTIVEAVKEDLKEEIQQKNAIIEHGELCTVNIIPFQFRQLIINLVSNSLKFAKQDQSPHIIIESFIGKGKELDNTQLEKERTYCNIRFSDDGIGFEPEYEQKIFDVFQRLHGRDEYPGTGIGLAIVKKIIENHNGTITARGEVGKGTVFNIYLPN